MSIGVCVWLLASLIVVLTEEQDGIGWAIANTLAYVVFAWSVFALMGEMAP